MGLSKNPTADNASLLRSSEPIEPLTRAMLADALEGKKSALSIRISHADGGKALQKFQKRLDRLKLGRAAIQAMEATGYDKAVSEVANQRKTGRKSIEANVALARRIDTWVAQVRAERPELEGLQDRELEMAYLYADAFAHDPDRMIKPSLPLFTEIVDYLQGLQTGRVKLATPLPGSQRLR